MTGYDIYSHFKPEEDLSGDIYDISYHKDCVYMFIADSMGKNAAASIFSLFILTRYRFLSTRADYDPAHVLNHLNK
jgi:sigma-B regulation protein RsbU (phosphoserine phosphatase)